MSADVDVVTSRVITSDVMQREDHEKVLPNGYTNRPEEYGPIEGLETHRRCEEVAYSYWRNHVATYRQRIGPLLDLAFSTWPGL